MANYSIGSLLLELGFQGEKEFSGALRGFERDIQSADKAGVSFYNNNRKGYTELKGLVEGAAASASKLEGMYSRGEIGADDYAKALTRLAQVQKVAEGGGQRLASGLSGIDNRLREVRTTAEQTSVSLQKYENRLTVIDSLHRAGVTSTGRFKQELKELGDEAMQSASKFDRLSDEYTQFISVAGKTGAIGQRLDQASLRESYFSRQFVLGNALSNIYGELGIRAIDMAANTVRSFDNMTVAWERSNDVAGDLLATSNMMGTSFAQVQADVDAVSAKYFMLATDAEAASASLLEAGYSTQQVKGLLDAVGASALQRGQDVKAAFSMIAQSGGDLEGALSSAVGGTEAFERALLRAAGGQQALVGGLTDQERQAALVAAVTETAAGALDAYASRTDGVVGAQLRQAEAVAKFKAEMGEELAPAVLRTTELMTRFLGVATSTIGPIVSLGEAVGQVAGHFSAAEVALLGLVLGGPKLIGMLAQVPALLTTIGTSLTGVIALLGGWPVVIAAAAAGAAAYFVDFSSDADKLKESLEGLETGGAAASSALSQIKEATDKEGLLAAVQALASTMEGEAAEAFTTFADEAVASADTTVGAIDTIYMYLAEKRREAVADALASLELAIAPLQDKQTATDDFNASPYGAQLTGLQERAAELERQKAALVEQLENADEQHVYSLRDQLSRKEAELLGVNTEIAKLQNIAGQTGAAAVPEQVARDQQQLNDMLERRKQLQQELNMLTARPRQAVNNAYGITPPRTRPENGPGGTPVDPLERYRDEISLARAEMNALLAEHERLGSVDSYVALAGGLQNYHGKVKALTTEMQGMKGRGDLDLKGQVELVNLMGELAALEAQIGNSDNVERERNAGAWVARLEQDLSRGTLLASSGMKVLSDAKANLEGEMAKFGGLELMTPKQQQQFDMFERMLELVEGGIETFQEKLEGERELDLFEGAKRSVLELIQAQKEIPQNLLDTLKAGGADVSVYDEYNAGIREGVENAGRLLAVQEELELSGLEMARNQRLNGEAVDTARNRAEALRTAIQAAYSLGTPQGDAAAVSYESELAVLDGMIAREEGLAAASAEVAAQVKFVEDAYLAADQAAGKVADAGGSGLEVQAARAQALAGALDEANESFGRGSIASRQLASGLGPVTAALKRLEAEAEGTEARFGDGGIAYTVALARQSYGDFETAVKALNLSLSSTGPLMDALRDAYRVDEAQAAAERTRNLAEAIAAVKLALSENVPVPEWAENTLDSGGARQDRPKVNLRESNEATAQATGLLSRYNAGLVSAATFSEDASEAQSALEAAMKATNTGTAQGVAQYKKLEAALRSLKAAQSELEGEQLEVDFQIAMSQTDGGGDAFLEWGRQKVAELRAEMAELDLSTDEGRRSWLEYQTTLNGVESAMAGVSTWAGAVALGFKNMGASLRDAEMEDAATGFEALSGLMQGLDSFLKTGSIVDGIEAIGQAFQQSEDVGLKALGGLLAGTAQLAAGIISGSPTAIIGGALTLLTTIIDVFTQAAKDLQAAKDDIQSYEDGSSVMDKSGAKTVGYESRGFLGDLFLGQKPIVIDDKSLMASFDTAESGFSSALSDAMKSYLQTGSLGDFRDAFKEAVLEGLIAGFIASEAFQGTVGESANNYFKVANDPNSTPEQLAAAEADLELNLGVAEQQMIDFCNRFGDYFMDTASGIDLSGLFSDAVAAGTAADLNLSVGIGDTSSFDAFKESFTSGLKDMIKQRLIEAFLESAAIKPLLDQLGAYLGEAMKDGVIDATEQANIDIFVNDITNATEPLHEALAGLEGDKRVRLLIDKGALPDLWKEYDRLGKAQITNERKVIQEQLKRNKVKLAGLQIDINNSKLMIAQLRGMGQLTAADQERLAMWETTLQTAEGHVTVIEDQNKRLEEQLELMDKQQGKDRAAIEQEIKVRLGIDEDSLRSSLSGAFDATSYEEFVAGFGTSITDTVRNAIVQAFLESAAMSAVMKKLSDAIFAALKDGNIDATELSAIKGIAKEAEALGGELYKLLDQLGLTVKKGGGGGGPDYGSWGVDKLYRERQKAADEGKKKRREEIELEIKARLQIGVEDLRGQLRSAFDSTSFGEFNKKWGESLRETTRNALITAFLEGAIMGPLLKQLSDQLMVAMADNKLSPEEKAGIKGTQDQISEEAKAFFKMLEEIGLGFKGAKKQYDPSKENIDQLYRRSGRGNKKATEEIKARLKIDLSSLKGDLRSAFDTTSLSAFHKSFGEALHETTRNALITAFMESAVMAPLLTALSNTIMAAVKDKNISEGEKAKIREDQAAIMAVAGPFFEALKAAGFGFKPKSEYDPSKDSIEKLYQREGRGNKKAREEIDMRLKIDVGTIRGALEQAFETTNLSAFHKSFGEAMRDITRNALISAFLESAVMQTLFKTFSATIRAALADGMISGGEMTAIKADQKAIADAAAPFFSLLKAMGMGFKPPAQAPNYSEMSMDELWRRQGKAKGKKREEIEVEIKGRLQVTKEDIAGQFRTALDSVSFGGFKRNLGASIRETTRNALIQSFMETSRMQSLFDRLGDVTARAVRNPKNTGWGRAEIGKIQREMEAEGKAMMQFLESVGLGFEEELSALSLDALWAKWRKDPGNQEVVSEIKARLSIDASAFRGAVASALDTPTTKEFGLNLEKNVKQSVRDGLIAAFMESAAMKPLLDKLSNDTMNALKDGKLSQKELGDLMKTGDRIKGVGQTFFDTLDDLGLGFKDLNDKVGQVSESLTNVPSGFKVAYARFQVADARSVGDGGGTMRAMPVEVKAGGGGVAEQFKGAQITFQVPQGFDLDDILGEMERRGAVSSGGRYGTPIVRRY